jgi:hypothetical protein
MQMIAHYCLEEGGPNRGTSFPKIEQQYAVIQRLATVLLSEIRKSFFHGQFAGGADLLQDQFHPLIRSLAFEFVISEVAEFLTKQTSSTGENSFKDKMCGPLSDVATTIEEVTRVISFGSQIACTGAGDKYGQSGAPGRRRALYLHTVIVRVR